MLPPEGPYQNINCEEKRPLENTQSVLVQQKSGESKFESEKFLTLYNSNFKSMTTNVNNIKINIFILFSNRAISARQC